MGDQGFQAQDRCNLWFSTHLLDHKLYQLYNVYFETIRPTWLTVPDRGDIPFFMGRTGKRVRNLCQEVKALGMTFGVENLTPVNIRKTVATRNFESSDASQRAMVVEHMAHREETQSQYYKAAQSLDQACSSSACISSLLESRPQSKSSMPRIIPPSNLPEEQPMVDLSAGPSKPRCPAPNKNQSGGALFTLRMS